MINVFVYFIIALAFINIINYWQIEWAARFLNEHQQLIDTEKQLSYQRQKYEQISESYRSGRRFIHDTKNHFFVMQKYLQEQKYDDLSEYIKTSFGELENQYVKYNTGNLVIDSFLTNFDDIAVHKNISFQAIIHVDKDRIPLKDFDLSILLGNMLDNALTACLNTKQKDRFLRIHIETTKNDLFIINEENSMDENTAQKRDGDEMNHGYGLKNIERTVTAYHGLMNITTSDVFHIYVRIPIIDPRQRYIRVTPFETLVK